MCSKHSALGSRILGINRNNSHSTAGNKRGVELAKVSREGKTFGGAEKTPCC